ncbi:hypothetical protein M3Y98_00238200 [Aphelenchoides besseyi]|nr:hypothetical protein M3Y98_00238200 [Aphelenchoides besseyi]
MFFVLFLLLCTSTIAPIVPGDRCENGGQYLGWLCSQAGGCQFATPSGILQGVCVGGFCCTIRTRQNQCPSNLHRSRRQCLQNFECTRRNGNRLLIGECHNSRCCLPRTNQKRRSSCRRGEFRTTTSCSYNQPCPFQQSGRIATCRNGRCCLRPPTQPANQCPANAQPIGACGVGNLGCNLWIRNSWVRGQCYNGVCCETIFG